MAWQQVDVAAMALNATSTGYFCRLGFRRPSQERVVVPTTQAQAVAAARAELAVAAAVVVQVSQVVVVGTVAMA